MQFKIPDVDNIVASGGPPVELDFLSRLGVVLQHLVLVLVTLTELGFLFPIQVNMIYFCL